MLQSSVSCDMLVFYVIITNTMAYWYDGAALATTRSPVIALFWCLIKFTTTTTTTTTTTNRSVSTAGITANNGKKFASQMQKADGFTRLHRDVSNLKLQKHERGVKKALSSRLRSEVVVPEVCQGFTTKVPQEWRVADIRQASKGGKDLQKMESYRPISLTSTVENTMLRQVTNRLRNLLNRCTC